MDPKMPTITAEFLDELVDFAPAEADRRLGFAKQQREGTVAIFNMLATNRCVYLADEVGMGKTYIALAVMSLLRYMDPRARIVVIAPRENIQRKWVKELQNFVRLNWRVVGNRVKALQGGPVWEPVVCNSLMAFAEEALTDQDRDFFLRMSSFSIALSNSETRARLRDRFCALVPWIGSGDIPNRRWDGFRDAFGMAMNSAIPDADLVVIDEAHNLKHGFGEDVSTRNRMMGLAFGRRGVDASAFPNYRHRAKRLLLLSATPFEDDYAAIQRQLDVFGFGDAELHADGERPLSVQTLIDPDADEDEKRLVVKRLLVRRVAGLNIAGEIHTKNMYRREWRRGGYTNHDEPIHIEDPKQRLIVALMQKKVAEILQSERFNNSFQIGMLSSFESFLQSVETVRRAQVAIEDDEPEGEAGAFDDDDQNRRASEAERRGIDTEAIGQMVRGYRERFGRTLPHPKLDATAAAHAKAFESGEKALIFVRRVATVGELAAKLEESFDEWVRARFDATLPELNDEIAELFKRYSRERARRPGEDDTNAELSTSENPAVEAEEQGEQREYITEEDEGGAESFFAWFFRGKGPPDVLSGAAFQKNRLSSPASRYVTLLDDDYVGALLGVAPADVIEALARRTDLSIDQLTERLRAAAYAYFTQRSRQRDGYPRLYVWEGYQIAGLALLEECGGEIGEHARIIRTERFPGDVLEPQEPPVGFPGLEVGLGITTVCTLLRQRPKLCEQLWPSESLKNYREGFRRREQRRELMSAMMRLGAAYIDLYLLAIRRLGSFSGDRQSEQGDTDADLAVDFVDLLERQSTTPGFHAFRELSLAASAFDQIVSVNFPEAPSMSVPELARLYGTTLQKQVPVGRMAGGVNKRLVRQFRMPGFPLVLVTTDVLQEGEDLHTFCKRIVHYGISWTPSAMEQRTGRIDRIGGLVQRHLDGTGVKPAPEDLIQVFYPHLRDTVEVLQVRRVLKRLNRFLALIHKTDRIPEIEESTVNAARALLEEYEDAPPIKQPLESAFPVESRWLAGDLGPQDAKRIDWERHFAHLETLWTSLRNHFVIDDIRTDERRMRRGSAGIHSGRLMSAGNGNSSTAHAFTLELRSQVAGEATLLRCEADVGLIDLAADTTIDQLLALEQEIGPAKLCVTPRFQKDVDKLFIRRDILFDLEATQIDDVTALLEGTVAPAMAMQDSLTRNQLLGGAG